MNDAWQVLGIAPSDDRRAIRRAYAARLKAIDVEAEPQKFVALRAAFEAAQAGGAPLAHALQDAPAPDATALLTARIEALLRSDASDAAIEDELTALTTDAIAAFEAGAIEAQIAGEEWVADTVAAHLPRSDAVVRPAVGIYKWRFRRHGQFRPNKATVALDRWRELSYGDLVLIAPTGRHHRAWAALQDVPPEGLFRRAPLATLDALDRFFAEVGEWPDIVGIAFDPGILTRWHAVLGRGEHRLRRWRRRQRGGWRSRMSMIAKLLVAVVVGGCLLALCAMPK